MARVSDLCFFSSWVRYFSYGSEDNMSLPTVSHPVFSADSECPVSTFIQSKEN